MIYIFNGGRQRKGWATAGIFLNKDLVSCLWLSKDGMAGMKRWHFISCMSQRALATERKRYLRQKEVT